MSEIKPKLWGFSKREVEDHILQTQQGNENKLDCLAKEIESLKQETSQLEQELSRLTDMISSLPSLELLDLSGERAEQLIEHINEAIEADIRELQDSSQKRLFNLENRINGLNQTIETEKALFRNLFFSFNQINFGQGETELSFSFKSTDKDDGNHEEVSSQIQTVSEQAAVASEKNQDEEDGAEKDEYPAAGNAELIGEVDASEQTSANLCQEIQTVRYQYLIGKLVGEEIRDDDGQVFIPKGAEITEEVIETAQKEGKMIELALNMVLADQVNNA